MKHKDIVLVVGSAGRIGQAVVAELQRRKLPVRGFDIVRTPGVDDCVVGDITKGEDLDRAATGVGTLIHLAATPDDDDFETKLLPNNIVGTYRVMEAARLGGVRRLVLACAAEARSDIRFAIVYASSKPIHRVHFDLAPARELVGFVPLETWPDGIEGVEGLKN